MVEPLYNLNVFSLVRVDGIFQILDIQSQDLYSNMATGLLVVEDAEGYRVIKSK